MTPRAARLERALEVPMVVAALLVIPILAIESSGWGEPWDTLAAALDWAIWLAFVAEMLAMLALVDDRRAWLRSHPLEVLIVLLTGPFLAAAFSSLRVLRVLRLLRLFRIARVARRIFSLTGLGYAALLALLTVVAGGQAFAELEKQSVGDGIYWAITTMSTVGYGDFSPETAAGKAVAVGVMLVGIGFVAILTGSIAERFLAAAVEPEMSDAAQTEAEVVRELRALNDRLAALEERLGTHGVPQVRHDTGTE